MHIVEMRPTIGAGNNATRDFVELAEESLLTFERIRRSKWANWIGRASQRQF